MLRVTAVFVHTRGTKQCELDHTRGGAGGQPGYSSDELEYGWGILMRYWRTTGVVLDMGLEMS